jgi:hypothetical protein
MTLEHLIRDPDALWTREAPAPAEAVERLAAALPELPPDYLAFLRISNGGEGDLSVEPGWFSLWPAEEVAELNAAYKVPGFLPGFLAFGSDGGGEMLAFGAAGERWGRVFAVPSIPMEAGGAAEIAPDFAMLVRSFGHAPPAA